MLQRSNDAGQCEVSSSGSRQPRVSKADWYPHSREGPSAENLRLGFYNLVRAFLVQFYLLIYIFTDWLLSDACKRKLS